MRTAVAAVFAAGLTFGLATPKAVADDRAHCQREIEKAESRVDHAIARNGEHSREADDRRRELNAERQRCWEKYHGWWNGHAHRWEAEHNWDHDDHHDNDHH
jgi:hypothetical protein